MTDETKNDVKKRSSSTYEDAGFWSEDTRLGKFELEDMKIPDYIPDFRYPMSGKGLFNFNPFKAPKVDDSGNVMRAGRFESELLSSIDFGNMERDGSILTMVTRAANTSMRKYSNFPVIANFRAWCEEEEPAFNIVTKTSWPNILISNEDINAIFRNPAPGEATDPAQAMVKYLNLTVADGHVLAKSFYLSSQCYFNSYLYEKLMCLVAILHMAKASKSELKKENVMPADAQYLVLTDPNFSIEMVGAISANRFVFWIDENNNLTELAILAVLARGGILLEYRDNTPRIARVKHEKIAITVVFPNADACPAKETNLPLPPPEIVLIYLQTLAMERHEKTDCIIGVEAVSNWLFQVRREYVQLSNNEVFISPGSPIVVKHREGEATHLSPDDELNILPVEKGDISFMAPTIDTQTPQLERRRAATMARMKIGEQMDKERNNALAGIKTENNQEDLTKDGKDKNNNNNNNDDDDDDDNISEGGEEEETEIETTPKRRKKRKVKDTNDIQFIPTGNKWELPKDHNAYQIEDGHIWLTPFCEIPIFDVSRPRPQDFNGLFRKIPAIMDLFEELIDINDEWEAFVQYSPEELIRCLAYNGALSAVGFGLFNLEYNITGFDYNRVARLEQDQNGQCNTIQFFRSAYFDTRDKFTVWSLNATWIVMAEKMDWYPHLFSFGISPIYNNMDCQEFMTYDTNWAAVFHHTVVSAVNLLFGAARFTSWPANFGIVESDFHCYGEVGKNWRHHREAWSTASFSTTYIKDITKASIWMSSRFVPEMIIAMNAICQQFNWWNTIEHLKISFELLEMKGTVPLPYPARYSVELNLDNFFSPIQMIIPGTIRTYDWYTGCRLLPWIYRDMNRGLWTQIEQMKGGNDLWDCVGLMRNKWSDLQGMGRNDNNVSNFGGPDFCGKLSIPWLRTK